LKPEFNLVLIAFLPLSVVFKTRKKRPDFDKKRLFFAKNALLKVKIALQLHFVKNKDLKLGFDT